MMPTVSEAVQARAAAARGARQWWSCRGSPGPRPARVDAGHESVDRLVVGVSEEQEAEACQRP